MRTLRLNWRVQVRDDDRGAAVRRAAGVQRKSLVVGLGLFAGALATYLAGALPARTAPLALLIVLVSTLLAGHLAPVGPALAHGACAWLVLAAAAFMTHRVHSPWHSIPALSLVLLLVEDMALIGRVGYVRQRIAHRDQPGA